MASNLGDRSTEVNRKDTRINRDLGLYYGKVPRTRTAGTVRWLLLPVLAGCASESLVRLEVPKGAIVLSGAAVYLGEGRTLDDALLVIDGDRIVGLSPRPGGRIALPRDATVIDLDGRTVVPGLIELHAHLAADGCFAEPMTEPRLRRQLRAYLHHGVTTVVDLGSSVWLSEERRRAREEEWDSPEILLAGPMITAPGGHPAAAEGRHGGAARRVSDSEEARLAVGEIADRGGDLVKAVLEAGGFGGLPVSPSLGSAELQAIADEAHARGLRLFVHVSSAAEAMLAIDAGADVLAHLPIREPMSEELAASLRDAKIPVISTLSEVEGVFRLLDEPAWIDRMEAKGVVDADVAAACRGPEVVSRAAQTPFTDYARAQFEVARRNVATLEAAGAEVVAGTDAGSLYVFHGAGVHRELELLVESGLSPDEALDAATLHAAAALGREDLGAIRPGRRADLLVVEGNVNESLAPLSRIEIVVRAGRLYRRDDL